MTAAEVEPKFLNQDLSIDQLEDEEDDEENDEENDGLVDITADSKKEKGGGACMTDIEDAETSNQTLIKWLPKMSKVEALLNASEQERTQTRSDSFRSHVHVSYQNKIVLEWAGEKGDFAGRTLEESFALQNLTWTQDIVRKGLGLRVVTKKDNWKLQELRTRLFKKVNGSSFKKTDFALGLLLTAPDEWIVPAYIESGLQWLEKTIGFPEKEATEVVQLAVAADKIIVDIETPKTDEQESK